LDREGAQERAWDQAQKSSQQGEDEAVVVADGGEDDVGGVAFAVFEMATAE
jgi:hypothetical protein